MRVVLTCCCGASIEASWDRRKEPSPTSLAKFEKTHQKCVVASRTKLLVAASVHRTTTSETLPAEW